MGREIGGRPRAEALSSIALLQERFRQLQRAKEMREEKEHLRGFAGGQSPRWFLHSELLRPSRPIQGGHRTEIAADRGGFPAACASAVAAGLRPDRPAARGMSGADAVDVDTSLHL